MTLQYLHFCGGFGQTAERPLRSWELLAVSVAKVLHPNATVLLHHGKCSWQNAPAGCEHIVYTDKEASSWKTWTCKHGAHMSDRVRLMALLKYGGLYQDTDSFMLDNCDELSQYNCALVKQGKTLRAGVQNCFIAAKPDSELLRLVYDAVDNYVGPIGWDITSAELYSKLALLNSDLLNVLDFQTYMTLSWQHKDKHVCFGPVTLESKQRVDSAKAFHVQSSGIRYKAKTDLVNNPPADSLFQYVLDKVTKLCQNS